VSPAELRKLFNAAELLLRDGECVVPTYGTRTQRIIVGEPEDGLLKLSTTIARPAQARNADFGHRECFQRNCLSELVGIRAAARGEIVAEAWVPVLGLSPELLKLYVQHLAITSDRWEHHLTGDDEH
jgi:hypothetical protein